MTLNNTKPNYKPITANINDRAETVLDSFLNKYSNENLDKTLEKRMSDIKTFGLTKNDLTYSENIPLNTIYNNVNSSNLLDSSTFDALKFLNNQSNIQKIQIIRIIIMSIIM